MLVYVLGVDDRAGTSYSVRVLNSFSTEQIASQSRLRWCHYSRTQAPKPIVRNANNPLRFGANIEYLLSVLPHSSGLCANRSIA